MAAPRVRPCRLERLTRNFVNMNSAPQRSEPCGEAEFGTHQCEDVNGVTWEQLPASPGWALCFCKRPDLRAGSGFALTCVAQMSRTVFPLGRFSPSLPPTHHSKKGVRNRAEHSCKSDSRGFFPQN
uniref:Uncharacterized protein n=1 Tax=Rousettus aegyptiacus TaxID=9407 RepID=A0A7J8FJQ8_ROUAE|nr:hypothetical protein HJG63_012164 [Rousettus aegyptiacus]